MKGSKGPPKGPPKGKGKNPIIQPGKAASKGGCGKGLPAAFRAVTPNPKGGGGGKPRDGPLWEGGPTMEDILYLADSMGDWFQQEEAKLGSYAPPPQRDGGKGGGKSKDGRPNAKMFVGGLPRDANEDEVRHSFEIFGDIKEVKMMVDEQGVSKGFCFVEFETVEDAQRVYENHAHNKVMDKWVDCKPTGGGGGGSGGGASNGGGAPPSRNLSGPPSNHQTPKAGDWTCPACGDLVFAWRDSCNMCGYTATPGEPKGSPGGKGGAPKGGAAKGGGAGRPGDWICQDCGSVVFSSKANCHKCGADKPASAQRIGMKDGDWTCPSCGDLVFASKNACGMCGAANPNPSSKGKGRSAPY
eukprot:TRINITY_DN7778_c1_g1_i3.p1 TRINITY_DN7778_c1_g1~~TRINITY_DN7778_c1_g1_i3.p1  ORF type:complete len:356 (+),score=79.77 TRINITY_DN7778_c1_g1_i3:61-1128(+)